MKKIFSLILLISLIRIGHAQISGTVFRDLPVDTTTLNQYGVKNTNENGIAGITVTMYPGGSTTTTAADGTWSFAVADGTQVRIEFSNWESYLQESPEAGVNNSSIQFVTAPNTTINFGLHNPNDFAANPFPPFISNLIVSGSGVGDSIVPSLLTNNYTDTGLSSDYNQFDDTPGTGNPSVVDATNKEIGTTWGRGYQKAKKRTFSAAVLWRHAGLGTGNPSSIWVSDNSTSPATILGTVDLQGISPANGGTAIDLGSVDRTSGTDYILPDDPGTPSIDLDAYAKAGKISYGDLDFDNNTNLVWTTNLNQRAIISMDAAGDFGSLPGTVNQYIIDNLPGAPTCTNGVLRPWGLGINDGTGYLGCVCDASISGDSTDLVTYVLAFDLANPAAGFTPKFSLNMDYERTGNGYVENDHYYAWSDVVHDVESTYLDAYNQPILADIDFDKDGNVFLGYIDRYGLQIGHNNHPAISGTTSVKEVAKAQGEQFKICTSSGTWELEGTGGCPSGIMADGDFFDDQGGDNNAFGGHGAMAVLKGSNQMLLSIIDPHPKDTVGNAYWYTAGVETLSTVDGNIANWYSHAYTGSPSYTGKGGSMGDIELLTEAAPIEIGNLVWLDANDNGIQDPNETSISGVTVELLQSGALLATATTDNNGNYIFSNDPNGTTTSSHIYNIVALVAGGDYLIRIPNISGASKQASLGSNDLGTNDIGEGTNTDQNDSDGLIVGVNGEAIVSASIIQIAGANNHSIDFGFKPSSPIVINSAVPSGCDVATNTYSLTVSVTFDTAPTGDLTITTENGASQTFTPASQTGTESFVLTGLTSDGVANIDVTATYVNDNTATNTKVDAYQAPANCYCPPSRCLPITTTKH